MLKWKISTKIELPPSHLNLILSFFFINFVSSVIKLSDVHLVITFHCTWSFPLMISSVNVTKSAISCGFGHIYWRNLNGRLHFLCSVFFLFLAGTLIFLVTCKKQVIMSRNTLGSNQRESVEPKYVGIAYGVPQGSFLRLLLLMFIETFFQVTSWLQMMVISTLSKICESHNKNVLEGCRFI